MKFDFSKSAEADLQNKLSINKLDMVIKNIVYVTYRVDAILKILREQETDKGLQKQVDEFFEQDGSPKENPQASGDLD